MNEVIKAIKSRRSVRKYSSEQLKREDLDAIIDAGLHAPSAHNQQSWHFTVIQNKELIDEINSAGKKVGISHEDELIQKIVGDPNRNMFYNAPTLVVVSGKDGAMMPREDCAAATQNMLIAAESIGVGSCWNGMVNFAFQGEDRLTLIKKMELPEGYTPYYGFTLGYSEQKGGNPPKRKEGTVTYL